MKIFCLAFFHKIYFIKESANFKKKRKRKTNLLGGYLNVITIGHGYHYHIIRVALVKDSVYTELF